MKKIIALLMLLASQQWLTAQSVGIGTNSPSAGAALDVQSTSKGMLVPRMSTAQRDAITPAPAGLLVFDNSTGSFWFKGNNNWIELVDTAKSTWRKNGDNTYTGVGANIGVRTTSPKYPLDVFTNDALDGYAMRLRNPNSTAGTKTSLLLSSSNVFLPGPSYGASAITSLAGFANSQHLLFSTSRFLLGPEERMRIDSSGNVGIGLTLPETKLHIVAGTDVTNTDGGFLQLGFTNGRNIGIDDNEIQQRNNGVPAKLTLQNGGGGLQVGNSTGTFNFLATGELTRNGITGTSDILPLSYGKVLFDGTKLGGTNNFTVTRVSTGNYDITLPNVTNLYANQDDYTILVTPFKKQNYAGNSFAATALCTINSNNTIKIYIREFDVNYNNISCNCYNETRTFTYITSLPTYVATDASFSFIIYKM